MTTVLGVKYTTARDVAERTLREICRNYRMPVPEYRSVARPRGRVHPTWAVSQSGRIDISAHELQAWMREESVVHIDDFLLRRCELLGMSWDRRIQLAEQLMTLLGWDSDRRQAELARLEGDASLLSELNAC